MVTREALGELAWNDPLEIKYCDLGTSSKLISRLNTALGVFSWLVFYRSYSVHVSGNQRSCPLVLITGNPDTTSLSQRGPTDIFLCSEDSFDPEILQ